MGKLVVGGLVLALGLLVAPPGFAADVGEPCTASSECTGPSCAAEADGCHCGPDGCAVRQPPGTPCREPGAADECASGWCAEGGYCCDRECPRECGMCNPEGTCIALNDPCTTQDGLQGYCENLECFPRKPLGSPCTFHIQCERIDDPTNPGEHCSADGVCCNQRCDGQCDACTAAGKAQGEDGTCGPALTCAGATCDGDHTVTRPDGKPQDCSPFKCNADGSCKSSCTRTGDCVDGTVCDTSFANGVCVPTASEPAAEDEGGCAVRRRSGGSLAVLAALLLAAGLWRQRRAR